MLVLSDMRRGHDSCPRGRQSKRLAVMLWLLR